MLSDGFYCCLNSVINTKHCFVYIPICISNNAWERIPEELRDKFLAAVQKGCEQQWEFLNEANNEAIELLKGVGVKFYDIDINELKAAYAELQKKEGTAYDPEWAAAVEAARAAVK